MRPSPNPSTFFAADQEWRFRIKTWDTPQTTLENDTSSQGLQLRVYQPQTEATNWNAYASALKSVAPNASPEAALTNAAFAATAVPDGRWPVVQAYWGSGTPNWWGGAYVGQVALAYSGTLVPAAQRTWLSASNDFTFAVAGSGWVRIDAVDGATRTTLFNGEVGETRFLDTGFLYSKTHTFTATTSVHVYYVQTKLEAWGGLVVKAIPGARSGDLPANASDSYVYVGGSAAQELAQDAPVVSCGLFSHGGAVDAVELPFILSASVTHEPGGAARADIEIPMLNPDFNDGNGWIFFQEDPLYDPGQLQVYDAGQLIHTLKRKRLIQVEVARKTATPNWVPIFTGHVDDFGSASNGRLTINCVSFEGRMVEQYEQAPDRISYMSRGYRVLDYTEAPVEDRKQPVYNVPAFDNWPLQYAVEELAIRAGVDPSCFRKVRKATTSTGAGVDVVLPWGTLSQFAARSLNGELVRLPRPVNYGNVGLSFTENRPFDDPYLFQVEPTKDLWARARELSDRLGYTCRFDAAGAAVLYPAASPSFVADLTSADVTQGAVTTVINPAAYGAKYLQVAANQAVTLQKVVRASRIDVSFPRVSGARPWTVTVAPASGGPAVTSVTVQPNAQTTTLQLFFNASVTAPGGNATVSTIHSGDYQDWLVTLTSSAAAGAAYVDCLIAYAQDPDGPILPTLSTSDAAMSVATKGLQDAVRNKVTIVGRRKSAVTDSDKFAEAQAPTEQEFVVQNAVDVRSITDPGADNYVGYLKQAMIYDDSIADDGLARYLAQVFIYRQSVPRPGTTVTHTLLPMVELNDPIAVEESKFDTAQEQMVQYIRRITHSIATNRFQTTIDTEAWPQYPAYQPRTDINLADFDNKPVTGLTVSYTSISGHAVTNPSPSLAVEMTGNYVAQTGVTISGNTLALDTSQPWPPMPGTFQLRAEQVPAPNTAVSPTEIATVQVTGRWALGQMVTAIPLPSPLPFAREVTIRFGGATTTTFTAAIPEGAVTREDYFYYEQVNNVVAVYRGKRELPGDPNVAVTAQIIVKWATSSISRRREWLANNPYHRWFDINYQSGASPRVTLPWEQLASSGVSSSDITGLSLRYRSLYPSPTPSDPNGIFNPAVNYSGFYDPYTSELGNVVSVKFSALAEGMYRVSIRNWDDDTVVTWLTNPSADPLKDDQHWEYLPITERTFTWDGVDQLGLWNALQSELYSELVEGTFEEGGRPRIGRGYYAWNREVSGGNLGPLAYIWMARNGDGTPIIGHGTYSRWYVHIEAQTTTVADTEVSSKDTNLAILTHLPEPTKLELKIEDWNGSAWTTPATNVPPTQMGAVINQTKPVRIRFRVAARPGVLWAGKDGDVSVKLTREAHLRAVIGDQTVVFTGRDYPGTRVEDRRIYNRRLVNDAHTKQYVDTGYRKARTFRWADGSDSGEAITEWVFYPQDFRKDFRIAGLEEPLEFGNYLQLEEVPQWNGARGVTAARSRLHFALMSYLFYLSAYVTDRSGRSSWGINQSFVDRSKIVNNTRATTWSVDPMYEQQRTIICRQWTGETAWKNQQRAQFGYDSNTLFSQLLESFWWQHDITSTTIGAAAPTSWSSYTLPSDPYSSFHTVAGAFAGFRLPTVYATSSRQLGDYTGGTITSALGRRTDGSTQQGIWSWENSPSWVPSITRDLHPFFLLPPMVSPPSDVGKIPTGGKERDMRRINCFSTVGGPDVKVSFFPFGKETNVADAGGAQTWSSPVQDFITGTRRFWPGDQVDVTKGPFKSTFASDFPTNVLNYVRQNEMIHYEELRGIYSRGQYPTAQPIKVSPAGAYYLNPHRYPRGIETGSTVAQSDYPLYHAVVQFGSEGTTIDWFRIAFRSEYLWESGSMFPTTRNGVERLEGVMWWRHRYLGNASTLYYDYGAWTGWKDDMLTSAVVGAIGGGGRQGGKDYASENIELTGNPFATNRLPVATSVVLPQTVELVSHLVLLPERRGD
jgi:hypothetical protein